MLAMAIKRAREHGARILEAYPVDQDSPSYRFVGFVPLFQGTPNISLE
jgi:sensor domain CHASE-containing protein